METSKRRSLQIGLAGAAMMGLRPVLAQAAYPSKPIRLIIPFAPGGGSDFIGRFVAQRMSGSLGQQVIPDNKPGVGSLLGIEQAVRSPSDGYTLALIASSYTILPSTYKERFKFDPLKDITPIIQLSQGPMLVVVNPALPVKSIKELVAYGKANPGKLNFASAGQGSVTHMAAEYFADMAGIKMTHVPYKGTGPALTDTMAGSTEVFFASTATSLPHVQSGKLRALGVTTTKRIPALPDVPTIAESGVPGYESVLWHGLVGPKDLPKAVVDRINAEANKVLAVPEAVKQLEGDGVYPAGGTPEQFRTVIEKEMQLWTKFVAKTGIKAE